MLLKCFVCQELLDRQQKALPYIVSPYPWVHGVTDIYSIARE